MDTKYNLVSGTKSRNFDAEFCGKVPLHQTNMIQPHGVLLVVDKKNFAIVQVSENAEAVFNNSIQDIINSLFFDHITSEEKEIITERLVSISEEKIPVSVTIHDQNYLAVILQQPSYLIIELEKIETSKEENSFVSIYQDLKFIIQQIEKADSIAEVSEITSRELKRFSGFDKVMIYQFDKDWNGTVLAEAKEEGMESFNGLVFPASDIPKQAREMYKKNAFRLIPNIDYTPTKLYPVINSITNAFTNLTDTNLRSVVAVHLEYLRNMKVVASMSTRILKDGELWGLIACHHRTPKYLSYQTCSVFELLSGIIGSKISALQNKREFDAKAQLHLTLNKIAETLYKNETIVEGLFAQETELLELLKADGFTLSINNEIHSFGEVPEKNQLEELIYWLQNKNVNKIFHQPSISSVFQNAKAYAQQVSGLVAIPIQPDKGNYLLAFRKEANQKINWSGNPNEALQFEANKKDYHPRSSFKIWQETVQNTSFPWKQEELEIAETFRNVLIEYALNNPSS